MITVSELIQLRRKNERAWTRYYIAIWQNSTLDLAVAPDDWEIDRYEMMCDVEYAKCSQENPCTPKDFEFNWDLHLEHIQDHCLYSTCSNCYVVDEGG